MNLPLFPLHTVLFPGCVLDLQIFEARYLDMISRCMKQGEGFGVVCIVEGQEVGEAAERIAQVGCEALIRDFQQRPNGLLGIRVQGGRRFRVAQAQVLPDRLTVAQIHWLDDEPRQPLAEEHADLLALLAALAEHPMVASLDMGAGAEGQSELANKLGYLLPFSAEQKIRLLALQTARERLAMVQDLVERLQGDTP
ncbi:LON peptidase substrate-binding domain-containing protein [Phytopseudomonas dryadis]|uniref:ATP-dependent protease n=1 Tax=Phytopseudomonas dryadis TaxID=2487520 RepID=A0A4Q9R6Y4_9GAMM|nr:MULTISPECIES: LON peptidase substrate-binding domain-containing protein [Pseudomonas]TBU95821.1 ATP-dependent protease [Pseudomonas dryadis]TBV08983.1 ATP-dependent protease [Pseudomonas dryadis]TBV18198.1 ATP-dependent protease [Pseudomonas sp. FRB 230]